MLTLGSLEAPVLAARLRRGLTLSTGPFRFRIRSRLPAVRHGLSTLYDHFALSDEDEVNDFHVRVDPVNGPRRWLRGQINFSVDGVTPFTPLPPAQGYAMLEWGMNWCIASQAHHYLLLHAAVLERNGRAVILPGDPGAGKSTLTAALMLSGWRLLSDELTMIDRDDGLVVPLARPVGLKNRSIDVIRAFDAGAVFGETAHDTHKGSVSHLRASADSVARMHERARPAHVVFPCWREGADAQLQPRSKADAFMHAATHAFNYSALGRLGFEMNAALIDACDCWDYTYSRLEDALRTFEDLSR